MSSPGPVHPEILVVGLTGHAWRCGLDASGGVPPRAISSPFDFVCILNTFLVDHERSRHDVGCMTGS